MTRRTVRNTRARTADRDCRPANTELPGQLGLWADDADAGHAAAAELPSVSEIAALTARLRHLRSPVATEAERAAFLADKNALLDRITAQTPPLHHDPARKD